MENKSIYVLCHNGPYWIALSYHLTREGAEAALAASLVEDMKDHGGRSTVTKKDSMIEKAALQA